MHRNNRHQQPKQKKSNVSKPYVPITSVYEQVRPFISSSRPIIDLSRDYLTILEQMSEDEIVKAIKNTSTKSSEFKALFERLQPHQRRALLEERALHEYSATAADANTGGYDGGGPPFDTDPDVQAYYIAVEAAGGNITIPNLRAIQTAVTAMKNTNDSTDGNSLWSHFQQAFFFVGQDSLTNGLYIPIVNTLNGTVVSNGNFTYSKTQGVIQDGVSSDVYTSGTAYIDTGIANNNTSFPANNRHAYAYISGFNGNTVTNVGPIYGENNITANRSYQFLPIYTSTFSRYDCTAYNNNAGSHATVTGFSPPPVVGGYGVYSSSASTTSFKLGTGRTLSLTTGTSVATGNTSNNILIGKGGNTGNGIGGNIYSFFSLGSKFGSSTSLDTMDTIISTLLTSLT